MRHNNKTCSKSSTVAKLFSVYFGGEVPSPKVPKKVTSSAHHAENSSGVGPIFSLPSHA